MPNLPTVPVTDAQADRVLAAFGSVTEYRKWLANSVRDYIRTFERNELKRTKSDELHAGLALIDDTDPLEGV